MTSQEVCKEYVSENKVYWKSTSDIYNWRGGQDVITGIREVL